MISGIVNSALEAVIRLELRGPSDHARVFDAVIDTGFTDYLTLPTSIIEDLCLPVEGATRVTLGGDIPSVARVCMAEIIWNNQSRHIPILEMSGVPLVGMSLLRGHHLHIHAVEGGDVAIR